MKQIRFHLPVFLLLILFLGLSLRLFQIGSDGFWVDELGVAQAAYAPNLVGVLAIVRGHVMAMPLDYVVAWGMGHFSTSEGWLRLPEALWGTLTLLIAYFLYRDHISKRATYLGILLLAISPMMIKYSQELRFYAPLVFFYTLSTFVGLRATRENKLSLWSLYTLVTILGLFFHLYVTFSFINVGIWFITHPAKEKRSLIPSTISFLLIFGSAAIAVAQFGQLAGAPSPLFSFETPLQVIGAGLGFLPPYQAPAPAYFYGLALFCFFIVGLISLRNLWPLMISIFLQVTMILGLDAWRGYFASARQLIPLLPIVMIFIAGGFDRVIEFVENRVGKRPFSHFPVYLGISVLLAGSLFVLVPYYEAEKTSTREILTILSEKWQAGNEIWVMPSYNQVVYSHYAPWLASALHPIDGGVPAGNSDGARFLLAVPGYSPGSDFVKLYQSPDTTFYPQSLWWSP